MEWYVIWIKVMNFQCNSFSVMQIIIIFRNLIYSLCRKLYNCALITKTYFSPICYTMGVVLPILKISLPRERNLWEDIFDWNDELLKDRTIFRPCLRRSNLFSTYPRREWNSPGLGISWTHHPLPPQRIFKIRFFAFSGNFYQILDNFCRKVKKY